MTTDRGLSDEFQAVPRISPSPITGYTADDARLCVTGPNHDETGCR
jgi:hypothetical protein